MCMDNIDYSSIPIAYVGKKGMGCIIICRPHYMMHRGLLLLGLLHDFLFCYMSYIQHAFLSVCRTSIPHLQAVIRVTVHECHE